MLKTDNATFTLFDGFTANQRQQLDSLFECRKYRPGAWILRQNHTASDLYLLASGEVEVRHVPYDGPSMLVDKLYCGDVFGWSSILGRKKYTASVLAISDVVVYCVPSSKLQLFCDSNRETGVVLLEKMASTVAHHPLQPIDQINELLRKAMDCHKD